MCQRGQAFSIGEHYHVLNRGAHKQVIFADQEDYQRFLILLLLANNTGSIDMRGILQKYNGRVSAATFAERSDKSLVDILAYTLMPNHFHLVLRQKAENGVSSFMHKVSTAYSMYFNTRHHHSGVVFQGRFKGQHVNNEAYYRYLFAYVHLNPLDLLQADWKTSGVSDINRARMLLSSYFDYFVHKRPESSILTQDDLPDFLLSQNDLEDLLRSEIDLHKNKASPGDTEIF